MKTLGSIAGIIIILAVMALCVCCAFSQTQISPATQVKWPLITGAGTPTSVGVSCTSANYGQPYQNRSVTPNTRYHCAADGWELETSSGINGVPYCTAFSPVAGNSITYTTTNMPNPCWAPTGGINLYVNGTLVASGLTGVTVNGH